MTVLGDRYRLGDVLGRGGVADIRRARDPVLDRDVAVKILRDTVDDADRSRFMGEATTLARLSHPGLVTVLDVGVADAQPYIVMELVEGPTLAAVLRDGALPLDQVAVIGDQLASAIAYAHEQGVVHRDVKPANVLLGQGGAKLADFGIARLIGDTVRHTRTGMTVGTPAYVSPEQVRGAAVGPPTDVYSLGLVLLEALTGERAFTGTQMEAALARLHRSPAVPDDLPDDWRGLLAAMTATDPGERPTAGAAAERIRALASTAPSAALAVPTATQVLEPTPAPSSVTQDDVPTERLPDGAAGPVGLSGPAKAVGAVVAVALVVVALAVGGAVLGGGDETPDDPATTPATSASTEPEPRESDTTTASEPVVTDTEEGEGEGGGGKGKKDKKKDKDKGGGKGKGKGGKGKG
ncbi:serine/threonine-protein kinase [Nocardioides immobilis]|uniref:serine/threonine-protein kinase n=1 Tax=Nocardioides immobilis TaxID=2049295 RepID=UPI0015FBF773|nr:serine/threonine-protein kinase [Nocardioides immobilis]